MNRSILFFAVIIFSCSTTKKVNQKINSGALPSFDMEGHRGCRGLMPENTITAMLKAIDLGVTTLEMDAVVTKDKKIILSHEPFFNHEITTKPDGKFVTEPEEKALNIYQMEYSETQKYDVGLKPHPRFPQQQKIQATKPLLADLIDRVEKYVTDKKLKQGFYNIETKSQPATDNIYHPAPAEFVELLVAVIRSKGIEDRVIIQSFDFRTLQYLHQHYPFIKTAMLIEDFDKRGLDEQLKALGFIPTIYSPDYSLVNDELLKKCHQQKIKVIPWTVDDKPTIDRLKSMGVDGIISDYPNLFNE
jgi:glycerophosphoryl diester phosphodiesterase